MNRLHLLAAVALAAQWPAAATRAAPGDFIPLLGVFLWALAAAARGCIGWRFLATLGLCALLAWRAAILPEPPAAACALDGLIDQESGRSRVLELQATVVEPPRLTAGGTTRLMLKAAALGGEQGDELCGTFVLYLRNNSRRWRVGERLAFKSGLRRISNLGNPGEFDWAAWNARRRVFATAFVWEGRDVEVIGYEPPTPVARSREAIVDAALGAPSSDFRRGRALVAALAAGHRGAIAVEDVEAMRDSGLAHLLAISGLHMGLVAGALFWVVRALALRIPGYAAGGDAVRPAALAAAFGLLGYAAVAGGGVSVLRAAFMGLVLMALLWRGGTARSWETLSAAALAVALLMPGAVREAGFQLSFAAVATLIAYGGWRARRRRPTAKLSKGEGSFAIAAAKRAGIRSAAASVVELFAVSSLCWWSTAPLVAQNFQRLSFVAPIANVLAAPLAAATVIVGLSATALLPLFEGAAAVAFYAAGACAQALLGLARWAAGLPGGGQAIVAPGWPLALCLSFAPALVLAGRCRWALGLALAAVALVAAMTYERYRDDRLELLFLSVGQGDSAVVKLPGGKVMVVDAGPPGRGRLAVAPLLGRMHIGRIDYLAVSHVQRDHWGGLEGLAESLDIGELWYPGGDCPSEAFDRGLSSLRSRGTNIIDLGRVAADRPGQRAAERGRKDRGAASQPLLVRAGAEGWRIEALWPRDEEGSCDDNDRSLLLSLTYEGRRILFAGDMEAGAERGLLAAIDPRVAFGGGVDVLKVPHHGSSTSSTPAFVEAVAPAHAVISVGRGNRFGLPSEEVEARWAEAGALVLRTDRDGAVEVRVRDSRLELNSAMLR